MEKAARRACHRLSPFVTGALLGGKSSPPNRPPRFEVSHGSCHPVTQAIVIFQARSKSEPGLLRSYKDVINYDKGRYKFVTPGQRGGKVTERTHVTAGAACVRQQRSRRSVTAELAGQQRTGLAIVFVATAFALATDGQVAAHGNSIVALHAELADTSLSNKADQSAFDALEGVVATKSSPGCHERLGLGQQQPLSLRTTIVSASSKKRGLPTNPGSKRSDLYAHRSAAACHWFQSDTGHQRAGTLYVLLPEQGAWVWNDIPLSRNALTPTNRLSSLMRRLRGEGQHQRRMPNQVPPDPLALIKRPLGR